MQGFIKLHRAEFSPNMTRGDAFFVNPKYIRRVDWAFYRDPRVNLDTALLSIDGMNFGGEEMVNIVFESIGEVMEKIALAERG